MWEFCTVVLHFDNFPGRFEWNDERMQSESSRRRRNDEFIGGSKLISLIIFVTSCYVLNKIFHFEWKFNARAIWDHPRAWNLAGEPNLTMKPSQNHPKFRKRENREKQRKTAANDEILMFKIHFRSADAANHLNARPWGPREIRRTRRAYWSQL